MQKRVIVTGVNGFVGPHVVDSFKAAGFYVIGVGYDSTPSDRVAKKIDEYVKCDLLSARGVRNIDLATVSAVIHLAGLSSVGQSFEQPHRYITENSLMTYNLLDAAQRSGLKGRIIVVSTGALYDPNQELPITEQSRSLENSPYAIGKLGVEHVSNYFRLRGLDTVVARPFNHIGPGQEGGFLLPDLYAQLRQAHTNDNKIFVGNLSTKRDYTDVRDIARAYKLIALADSLSENLYNICSGHSVSGKDVLRLLQAEMGLESITVAVDETKIRPTDIDDIYGDASTLTSETGWRPEILLEKTIADFVGDRN